LDAAAFGSGGGEPKAAAKLNTHCISKKAVPRRPPSEASAHRSRAVKCEIRERRPRRGALNHHRRLKIDSDFVA